MHLQPLWCGQASKQASSKGNRKVSGIKEGRAEGREGGEKASKGGRRASEGGAREGGAEGASKGRTTLAVDATIYCRN